MVNGVSALPALAAVNLGRPGHYLHWGVIQISLANVVVILLMLALFLLALLLPFPGEKGHLSSPGKKSQ